MKAATLVLAPQHAGKVGFRVRELSDYGISKSQAHALIRKGRLGAVHLDGVVIVPRAALETYLSTAIAIEPKADDSKRRSR